ncbi:recombinase family protein [Oceanobacillus arenosus]|uniref:Recombinase family protein n=1 Tax=Oceanobacillus arenosus TaxID=1229153 RepID=A0A3D8PMW2_9BACI|nr:recombinase family protein [Oceanobacillus arenosus]RDW17012.1 recombinase family protein [Oceanobacillus arenosus]
MKAALYIRVSTREQIENYSIPSQKEKLEAYCKSKGWEIYDFYIDGGFSGSNTDRPDLQRMISDIKEIDVVMVYKLDRLSRSQKDTLELIEDTFLKNNVEFVSLTETLDTSSPFGRAMIGILSVFAQLERENIAERMRNGHIKRAEDGYRGMGGDYDPAGYARVDGELVTKPDEKKHVQLAFDLYERYHSITKVQKELKLLGYNVWRFRRYRDILANRLYVGYVSFAGEHYKGRHEAFIAEEQYDRVQALLEMHKGANAQKAKESLLAGLITCSCCGEKFVTYTTTDRRKDKVYKYRYYLCKARRFPIEYGHKCTNKNWNSKKLEEIIIKEIQFLSIGKKNGTPKIKKVNYEVQIKKVTEKIERVLGLYAEGTIPKQTLDKQIEIYNTEKDEILKRQKENSAAQNVISDEEIDNLVTNLTKSDFPTKRAAIQKLVKQISINGEDIDISWNF